MKTIQNISLQRFVDVQQQHDVGKHYIPTVADLRQHFKNLSFCRLGEAQGSIEQPHVVNFCMNRPLRSEAYSWPPELLSDGRLTSSD